MEREWIHYFAAIILPDGRTALPEFGHVNLLANIYGNGDPQIAWNDMPIRAHSMFWLINKTGCAVVDYNSVLLPEDLYPEQQSTLTFYRAAGLLGYQADYAIVTMAAK